MITNEISLLQLAINNPRGQGLIQVLVAVGIMSVVLAAFSTMMSNQSRESRALAEKLATLDLQQLLTASLADGAVCKYVLNNPSPLTFDSTNISPSHPQIITLPGPSPALYTGMVPNPNNPSQLMPAAVAAQVGKPASAVAPSLLVKSIELRILSGSNGGYLGEWLVNFESSSAVRGLRPVSVATVINADTTVPTAARVVNCAIGTGTGTGGGGTPPGGTPPGGTTGCGVGQEIKQALWMRDPRDPSVAGFAMGMTAAFNEIADGTWPGITHTSIVGWSGVNGISTSPFFKGFYAVQTTHKFQGTCTGLWKLVGWSSPWGYGANFSNYELTWLRVN